MRFKKGQIPWNKDKKWHRKKPLFRVKKNCFLCKKEFSVQKHREKTAKFCSLSCRAKQSKKEGKFTYNWKGKVGARKGFKATQETIKKSKDSHTGYKMRLETKKKLREIQRNIVLEGKHNRYKGGITPENHKIRNSIESRLWREAVFARDNWTCQKTGVKGGKLHPHHINNFADFPELRFAIDNGITLSEKAHREFHKKYGFKNNTKSQLEEFLNV